MADSNFNRALREVVSREFAGIPMHENDIPYSFSNGFLCKMNKLKKSEQSRFWKMTCTAPRRVAVILVSLLVVTLTACSFPSVRAAATKFIQETYENCVRFFTEDSSCEQISEHYQISELPDGFVEESVIEDAARYTVVYQNDVGNRIVFSQSITDDYWIDIDSENGKLYERNVSDMDVSIYESEDCIVAIWLHEQYAFNITCYGGIDLDQIIMLISSVHLQ